MSELKLSEFLAEHKASEFGLAPVSKAMAVKMAKALEAKLSKMEEALDLDRLATIEHTQWMAWARTLMEEEPGLSASRQDRWQAMMVDYSELPEETKEYDREWARIVIGEALAGSDDGMAVR